MPSAQEVGTWFPCLGEAVGQASMTLGALTGCLKCGKVGPGK